MQRVRNYEKVDNALASTVSVGYNKHMKEMLQIAFFFLQVGLLFLLFFSPFIALGIIVGHFTVKFW